MFNSQLRNNLISKQYRSNYEFRVLLIRVIWVKDSLNQETLSFGHSISPLEKDQDLLIVVWISNYLLIYFLEKLCVMQNVKCNHTVLDSQLVSARFLTRNFMEFNSLVSPGRSTYVAFSWKCHLRHCRVEQKFHKSPVCFSENLTLFPDLL